MQYWSDNFSLVVAITGYFLHQKVRTYAKIWTSPEISVSKLTFVGELLNVMGVAAWLCGKYCWQRLVSMKIILYK